MGAVSFRHRSFVNQSRWALDSFFTNTLILYSIHNHLSQILFEGGARSPALQPQSSPSTAMRVHTDLKSECSYSPYVKETHLGNFTVHALRLNNVLLRRKAMFGKVRKTRSDCTVGTYEKKHDLPTGTLRNSDGRKARKDKTLKSLRKETGSDYR